MTDFFVKAGVDGMTVLGQLGEAPKMTHDEVGRHREARDSSRARLPIVVGVSAPGFAAMRALTQDVMALGRRGRHDRAAEHAAHRRLDRRSTTSRPSRRSARTCRS